MENKTVKVPNGEWESVAQAIADGSYYEAAREKDKRGWTDAVDGSGEKPTIQTSRKECCW